MRFAKTLAAAALVTTVSVGSASAASLNDNSGTGNFIFQGNGIATATINSDQSQTGANYFSESYTITFNSSANTVSMLLTSTGTSISNLSGVFSSTGSTTQPTFTVDSSGWLTSTSSLYFQAGKQLLLTIAGNLDPDASGAYTAKVQVSAVPLPAALPMFGAALAGLGGFAFRRKAKKAA